MDTLKNDIDSRIYCMGKEKTMKCTVSVDEITKLAKMLKHYKNDGSKGLVSDCLINGPHRLFVHICILFNMLITHGTVPGDFLVGTMIPIPKSKTVSHISDKYRAITLSSSIGKMFDLVIINHEGRYGLKTDCLQFGFKCNSSTVLCTGTLQETICHFVNGGCNIFGLFLDATKAFDRINYVKLFRLLLKKDMDPKLVRCLMHMYTNQSLRVSWNGVMSDNFNTTNGVKQGGVLSPLLFSVYIDELICRLRKSGIGCYIGPHYSSVFGYADDLCIIANSLTSLRSMIKICEDFATEYDVIFNGSKSQLIKFSANGDGIVQSDVFVCGVKVSPSKEVIHLGNKLFCNPFQDNCDNVVRKFYKQYNQFIAKFRYLPLDSKCKLFNSYCTSFYGLPICNLQKANKLHVAVRKCLRHMLGIPYRSHCKIVYGLMNSLCVDHMCQKRFLCYAKSVLNHHIDSIRFIHNLGILEAKTIFAKNTFYCSNDPAQMCVNNCEIDNMGICSVIRELLYVREGSWHLPRNFNTNDVCEILIFLCTV